MQFQKFRVWPGSLVQDEAKQKRTIPSCLYPHIHPNKHWCFLHTLRISVDSLVRTYQTVLILQLICDGLFSFYIKNKQKLLNINHSTTHTQVYLWFYPQIQQVSVSICFSLFIVLTLVGSKLSLQTSHCINSKIAYTIHVAFQTIYGYIYTHVYRVTGTVRYFNKTVTVWASILMKVFSIECLVV